VFLSINQEEEKKEVIPSLQEIIKRSNVADFSFNTFGKSDYKTV
jgi:hypothetical protein